MNTYTFKKDPLEIVQVEALVIRSNVDKKSGKFYHTLAVETNDNNKLYPLLVLPVKIENYTVISFNAYLTSKIEKYETKIGTQEEKTVYKFHPQSNIKIVKKPEDLSYDAKIEDLEEVK